MSKSDALATKEMPFRVYMGYDSHEDITFEVRRLFEQQNLVVVE